MEKSVQTIAYACQVPLQRRERSLFFEKRYAEGVDEAEALDEEEGDLFSFCLRSMKGVGRLTKLEEREAARRLERGRGLIKRVLLGFPLACEGIGTLMGKEGVEHWASVRQLLWRRRVPDSFLVEEGEQLLTWCVGRMEEDKRGGKEKRGNSERIWRELQDLGKKIHAGKTLLYQAREALTLANLAQVVRTALKFTGWGVSLPDLLQEGSIGLMKALEKFDYRKGLRFSVYASWYIRREMLQAIASNSGGISLPLAALSEEIHQKFHREPLSQLSSSVLPPDQELEEKEKERVIWEVLNTLPPLETEVIRRRFGIGREREETLEEIGRALGFTREWIRQVEERALRGLRHPRRFALLKRLVA